MQSDGADSRSDRASSSREWPDGSQWQEGWQRPDGSQSQEGWQEDLQRGCQDFWQEGWQEDLQSCWQDGWQEGWQWPDDSGIVSDRELPLDRDGQEADMFQAVSGNNLDLDVHPRTSPVEEIFGAASGTHLALDVHPRTSPEEDMFQGASGSTHWRSAPEGGLPGEDATQVAAESSDDRKQSAADWLGPSGDGEVPRSPSRCISIPCLDIWGQHRGALLDALSRYGVVYLVDSGSYRNPQQWLDEQGDRYFPEPNYSRWLEVLNERQRWKSYFYRRPCVAQHCLRFSNKEDLSRTREWTREHMPDNRAMFGVSASALRTQCDWGDLQWILSDFTDLKASLTQIIRHEISPRCEYGTATYRSFEHKLRRGYEGFDQSVLRHCFYPEGGTCTEHTDYGIVTIQHCSCAGLEGFLEGQWVPVQPAKGCIALFAGDMLERLTNGHIRALLHRVHLNGSSSSAADGWGRYSAQRESVRQSHIMFLQPDHDTVVAPLPCYRANDGTDLEPIRYGDWHRQKVHLAFGHGQHDQQRGRGGYY